LRFKAISSRNRGGAAWSLPPSNRGAEIDPKSRDLALLSFLSLSCAVSAGFLARCFLPSVQSQCSARPMGSGADMDKDYLTLKRASASRLSGE
jgi:hypothetical protein